MNIVKIKSLFRDIAYVSKKTNVSGKKLTILFTVVFSNLTVMFDLLIIIIFASIFSDVDTSFKYVQFFTNNLYLLPFVVVFRFVVIYLEKSLIYRLQLSINENLRSFLLDEVYQKGNYSIADASFYVTKLTEHVSFFYSALTAVISASIQLLVYLTYLIISDGETVLYFTIFAIFLTYPTYKLLKLGRSYMHEAYVFSQNLVQDIQRVIDNLFLIKILNTKKIEFQVFQNNIENFSKSQFNNFKYGTINFLIPNFVMLFSISVLISFTSLIKMITLEFIGVLLRLVQTLGVINNNLNMLINSHVHLEKFHEIEKNKFDKDMSILKLNEAMNEAISLDSVSFKYFGSDNYLYENLTLSIPKNKHTVILGSNGSGKSTLLGLLSGVFVPNSGTANIASNRLSYIGATPLIISASLRDNLLYGNNLKIEDEKLLRMLELYKVFNNESVILDAKINNKSLSSGQMQKISFIRAMLSDTEILFLDESTSNLDDESKKLISANLDDLDITIVNCTHNPEDFKFDQVFKVTNINQTSIVST